MEISRRGEVRRIHIIYFLSHMGSVDHPHLIRVHHLHRNGVHLRDVKRWLAGLRGKDMPDSFSWSYKRRYKSCYVWQDLVDDDLITPISDNEYVLKGSEIFPTSPLDVSGADYRRKSFTSEKEKQSDQEEKPEENQAYPDRTIDTPTKSSSEFYQEYSPIFTSETSSSSTDDSIKQEHTISPSKQESYEEQIESFENQTSYVQSFSKLSLSESAFSKSKSHSTRTTKILRNLITCGSVDTNDAVLVGLKKFVQRRESNTEICKDESLSRPVRVFATQWNQQHSTARYV